MQTPTEISPYRLMQEEFREEPWKLLVACICLNQCSAKVARPIWEKLFLRWPGAGALIDEIEDSRLSVIAELSAVLRPLGFQNRRAERIVRMTDDLSKQMWANGMDRFSVNVWDLYGCGKYAADSYNMFVKGTVIEDVQDKELRNYVSWVKERHGIEQGTSHRPG